MQLAPFLRSPVARSAFAIMLLIAPVAAQSTPTIDATQASAMLRDSNFAGAAAAYTALTEREPGNPGHWTGLGLAEISRGQYAQSEAAFLKALALYPATQLRQRHVTWYNIASARARQGKIDAAFVALDSIRTAPWVTPQMLDGDPDMASLLSDARMAKFKQHLALAGSPCDTMPKAREFDFWIGEWDVHAPGGGLAGSSVIQKVSNGCALLENWTSLGPGTGKSLNFYNARAGFWQQTWVGAAGGPVEYREGVLRDSTLSFLVRSGGPESPVVARLSFTRLGPNRVRQHAEGSSDNGATWTTSYDFLYLRKGSGEKP